MECGYSGVEISDLIRERAGDLGPDQGQFSGISIDNCTAEQAFDSFGYGQSLFESSEQALIQVFYSTERGSSLRNIPKNSLLLRVLKWRLIIRT